MNQLSRKLSNACFILLALLGSLAAGRLHAADYQWSVPVAGTSLKDVGPDYPRAFLWIPPTCEKVRAVLLSENNMEEESILEDPGFRKTLSDLGFAEIWVTPSLGSIHFRFDQGEDQVLAKVLKDLADQSGYPEIANAPLVPIGHSATASFGWDVAAWNPARTLAVISISGQWPYYKDANMGNNSSPDWGARNVDGVPGLTTKGEYEIGGNTDGWYFHLKGDSMKKHPQTVFTQVVEPGGSHFNASQKKIALVGLFLRKAAQYRLPADSAPDGSATLIPIDPTKTGWLFDQWHLHTGPASPAAAVADYQGNRDQSFWAFDEEMAQAIEDFQAAPPGQSNVLVGYRQSAGLTAPRPDHAMVHLQWEPQPDGITFKLTGGFWDNVPASTDAAQKPEWAQWLGEGAPVNVGDPINHPQGADSQITIARITGPVVQTAPDTFVIHPYRIGTHDVRKSNDIWLAATWPGDATYKPMVQQAELQIPLENKAGAEQTITFPEMTDQVVGAPPIQLAATASSQAPISYYVREGPAEVDANGLLTLLPLPPKAKYPVTVTVVATQWGRSIEPRLQTAEPVERSFAVNRK